MATTIGNEWNWCGTQAPTLMTDPTGAYQGGVLIRFDFGVTVFKRNLTTGVITTFDLSANTNASAGLNLPINSVDTHWALALLIDGAGYWWIAGNSHSSIGYGTRANGGLNLIRSTNPNDMTAWTNLSSSYPPTGWPIASAGVSATGANVHTYHHFDRLSNGDSIWVVDQEEDTTSSRGRDLLAFRLPNGSFTWSPLVGQGEFATSARDVPQGTTADRCYIGAVVVEPRPGGDRVHAYGLWRTFDAAAGGTPGYNSPGPDPPSQMRPWYIYSDNWTNSAAWKRVNGTSQTMPITWLNSGASTNTGPATVTSANSSAQYNRNFSRIMGIDSNGLPHLAFQYEDTLSFLHCYWDGSAWQSETIFVGFLMPAVFCIRNHVYGFSQNGFRVFISNVLDNNVHFRFGHPIQPPFYGLPDPIKLRQGELSVMMPDGDTPVVHDFGRHAYISA